MLVLEACGVVILFAVAAICLGSAWGSLKSLKDGFYTPFSDRLVEAGFAAGGLAFAVALAWVGSSLFLHLLASLK